MKTSSLQLDYFIGWSDNKFNDHINKLPLKQKEQLYLDAKNDYYKGKPFMSDHQFDTLETELKRLNSSVTSIVGGSDDKNLKHKHWSPMLSLEKIQVNDEDNFPINDILDWNKNLYPIEATPKYDGNAIELQYDNGKLVRAVTRGQNGKGGDVTSKMSQLVPTTISSKLKLEIRGEVVMSVKVFNAKYAIEGAKNPRNTVAGIINPSNSDNSKLPDCMFVAYSAKVHDDAGFDYLEDTQNKLALLGFNAKYPVKTFMINGPTDFRKAYDFFKAYRGGDSLFQLDGIVFKMPEAKRLAMGDTSHHPKWAVALKFPSKEAQTKIVSIEWNMGYTGELTPVGILEPVDLDGSTVSRVSIYNKNKIEEMGMFAGAVVNIKKSGDIIPMITKIVRESPNKAKHISMQDYYPTECPSCKGKLTMHSSGASDNVHIMCFNHRCPAQAIKKLANGITALEIKGIGESICADLFESGIHNMFDFFTVDKMNSDKLIAGGYFQEGRALDLVLACPDKLKEIELNKVILALQFTNLGNSGSKEVAKLIAKVPYSFEGLEKSVVNPFLDENSPERRTVAAFMRLLKGRGVNIINPIEIKGGTMTFEMTGSPSSSGYDTKDDLVKFLKTKGYVHTSLKDAKILLTDSIASSSTKMKAAAKKGVQIMTYEQIIKTVGK